MPYRGSIRSGVGGILERPSRARLDPIEAIGRPVAGLAKLRASRGQIIVMLGTEGRSASGMSLIKTEIPALPLSRQRD
jgi:hypothetical protein